MLEINVFSVIMLSAFAGVITLGLICAYEEAKDIIKEYRQKDKIN